MMGNNPIGIDVPPVYDNLIQGKDERMSDIWIAWISIFTQLMSGYITQTGFNVPNLTSSQRDSIQSPNNGQLIYNVTLNVLQFYQVLPSGSSWKTVSFT